MTLIVGFRAVDGLVLAADTRKIAPGVDGKPPNISDSSSKIFWSEKRPALAVASYGLTNLSGSSPKTSELLFREFVERSEVSTLTVDGFAKEFCAFLSEECGKSTNVTGSQPMSFLVGGFDKDDPFSSLWKVQIPAGVENCVGPDFRPYPVGDPRVADALLNITPIEYGFLPLSECVELSRFLVEATIKVGRWWAGVALVGGHVEVVTITKHEGVKRLNER